MLAVTPRACESGRPGLNGHPLAGDRVLCRLSDARVRSWKSLRQESNLRRNRTKGACCP
jgi:hypothetical protein